MGQAQASLYLMLSLEGISWGDTLGKNPVWATGSLGLGVGCPEGLGFSSLGQVWGQDLVAHLGDNWVISWPSQSPRLLIYKWLSLNPGGLDPQGSFHLGSPILHPNQTSKADPALASQVGRVGRVLEVACRFPGHTCSSG